MRLLMVYILNFCLVCIKRNQTFLVHFFLNNLSTQIEGKNTVHTRVSKRRQDKYVVVHKIKSNIVPSSDHAQKKVKRRKVC
jgi:hypothetical protein